MALENKNRAYGYTLPLTLGKIQEVALAMTDTVRKTTPGKIAPPTKAQPAKKQTLVVSAPRPAVKMDNDTTAIDEVIFPFNSDVPEKVCLPLIDKYISFLKSNKEIKVEIAGFTDPIGNEKYNMDLSLRRALWVKNYMAGKGISRKRIKVIGFADKMLVSTEKGSGMRLNRRVEFNFTR